MSSRHTQIDRSNKMNEKPLVDNVTGRGKTGFSLAGTSLFTCLRSLDPFLQYSILRSAPLTYLLLKLNLPFPTPPPNSPIVSFTGLGSVQSLLWYMSIGSSVKQIFHMVFIFKERKRAHGTQSVTETDFA